MTIGYVLLAFGVVQVGWAIWDIRYDKAARISMLERALADVVRTTPRPKSRWAVAIGRASHWIGLAVGLLIVGLGIIFILGSE
jgi:hypothetical protein